MQDSIFTKIIRGEIPCHKVYEDDKTFVFLDINPIRAGHVLVVPKSQVQFVWELDDDDYQALMVAAKKVANRIKQVLAPNYVGEHIAGEEVPHAHIHLFPFDNSVEFWTRPDPDAEPDHDALEQMAQKLAF